MCWGPSLFLLPSQGSGVQWWCWDLKYPQAPDFNSHLALPPTPTLTVRLGKLLTSLSLWFLMQQLGLIRGSISWDWGGWTESAYKALRTVPGTWEVINNCLWYYYGKEDQGELDSTCQSKLINKHAHIRVCGIVISNVGEKKGEYVI